MILNVEKDKLLTENWSTKQCICIKWDIIKNNDAVPYTLNERLGYIVKW